MKLFFLVFITFFVSFNTIEVKCQSLSEPFSLKGFERDFVSIGNNIFACKYETSNRLYLVFLNSRNDLDDCSPLQIDSLNWENEPMITLYHRHPEFYNYPVVNISYEAAVEFCKWLTDSYNAYPQRKYKKVEIKLPSSEEWNLLYNQLETKIIYLENDKEIVKNDKYKETNGCFNIVAGVKEMTSEKGLAKGYDWFNSNADLSTPDSKYSEKSAIWLGFRLFMFVIQ